MVKKPVSKFVQWLRNSNQLGGDVLPNRTTLHDTGFVAVTDGKPERVSDGRGKMLHILPTVSKALQSSETRSNLRSKLLKPLHVTVII
jgi:hypothetical protein